ncbi:subtilase 1.3 [Actinidia rufa]|uniref:Subtilase 1.3 n=1 Tax=Actinidia rufa TaxID=165716 RepID=A0A7J0EF57_9ERIC|nr:subtilase 1.3 [Actinidia rufa]
MPGSPVKWLLLFLSSLLFLCSAKRILAKKTYIVQMDKSAMPETFTDHSEWYASVIKSVATTPEKEASGDDERIIYTYQTAFHGVAARLSEEEAERLEELHGVMAIFPETKYELHTTRSPVFLGLEPEKSTKSIWSDNLANHDVIVGVLDTGIWPESQSFNDTGMTPVPAHWKGACETGRAFTRNHCNRKIVGARVFYRGIEAVSVGGAPVRGANLLGYAYGTARGMAPSARIAAYKVCWVGGCFSSDILSAVDRAVADGVNVLSISLGGGVSPYYRDSLAIATFGAMEMGIFVSCSAGNGGPDPISLTNVSPWITTVGASTIDREFPATVKLGSGTTVTGVSLYKGRRNLSIKQQYPLVYTGSNSSSPDPSSLCLEGTLDPRVVVGKIVICDRGISPRVQKGQVVKDAGGVGMLLSNTAVNGEELVADSHLLPAVAMGETAGKAIKHYALTNPKATATLAFLGTRLGIRPSPVVAAFSSRGPNFLSLEIMKPDFVAPGVNILAAWTGDMVLKARHPEWSPAAIKSALMTTAYVHDNTYKSLTDAQTGAPSNPYEHGAGHIHPLKALDPGLVYDIKAQDYFEFLCSQALTPGQLQVFAKFSKRSCRHSLANPGDLNYPALSAVFPESSNVTVLTLHRTVTNVGPPVSNYHVKVSPFKGAFVKVEPEVLKFTSKNQKLSYKVTFTTKSRQTEPEFGSLIWKDGLYRVRSPVAITWLS